MNNLKHVKTSVSNCKRVLIVDASWPYSLSHYHTIFHVWLLSVFFREFLLICFSSLWMSNLVIRQEVTSSTSFVLLFSFKPFLIIRSSGYELEFGRQQDAHEALRAVCSDRTVVSDSVRDGTSYVLQKLSETMLIFDFDLKNCHWRFETFSCIIWQQYIVNNPVIVSQLTTQDNGETIDIRSPMEVFEGSFKTM